MVSDHDAPLHPALDRPVDPQRLAVDDGNGQSLAYVSGRDEAGVGKGFLTVYEARRIAVDIAQLPELLKAGAAVSPGKTCRDRLAV